MLYTQSGLCELHSQLHKISNVIPARTFMWLFTTCMCADVQGVCKVIRYIRKGKFFTLLKIVLIKRTNMQFFARELNPKNDALQGKKI